MNCCSVSIYMSCWASSSLCFFLISLCVVFSCLCPLPVDLLNIVLHSEPQVYIYTGVMYLSIGRGAENIFCNVGGGAKIST